MALQCNKHFILLDVSTAFIKASVYFTKVMYGV
jgi:hypothetical protein